MDIQYTEKETELFKQAIATWGTPAQLRVMQEELAECIVAIGHYLRQRHLSYSELCEEMADVLITLSQHYLLMKEDVQYHYGKKLKKLEAYLAQSEKKPL